MKQVARILAGQVLERRYVEDDWQAPTSGPGVAREVETPVFDEAGEQTGVEVHITYDGGYAASKGAWVPVVDEIATPAIGEVLGDLETIVEADQVRDVREAVRLTVEGRRGAIITAAKAKAAAVFAAGFTVALAGPLEGHVLALRDELDRTNWLTLESTARDEIEDGNGATVGAGFRTLANENVATSFDYAKAVLRTLKTWGQEVYKRLFTIEAYAEGASTHADLDAVVGMVETGWPS